MDILEQVGITKEELIERIVTRALGITAALEQTGEESWEEVPFSDVIDKKVNSAIGNFIEQFRPMIQFRINEIMNQKMNEVFEAPFQPVDKWGNKKGDETTIRDLIALDAKNYWSEKVDENGDVNSSYNNKMSRSTFYAHKVMTEFYNKELVSEVKKLASEMKAKIPATISEEISKTIIGYLK
jgi:hypothetical protein